MEEQKFEQNIKQQTIEQKIADLKKITKNDGDEAYSEAQLELAKIYFLDKKNSEAAIKHLLKVEKLGNSTLYTEAQFNLALIYQDENNIAQAKCHYLQIEKSVDPILYAQAQFKLAQIYQDEKNNIAQAEHHYLQVQREDNADAYARAQCNLALIYEKEKQDIEQAEHHYLQVQRQDNADAYAKAQFNLALIYEEEKQDIEQAEHHYLQVQRQDNADAYAKAQYNLALIYEKEKQDIEQAEHHYLQVQREDNANAYARAQCNLALINQFKKQDIEQAERHYLRVKRQDNADAYAKAQFNLALIYEEEKQDIEQAEYHYLQVKKQDNADVYAEAQWNLALIYQVEKQDIEQAEHYYLQVQRQDNADAYAKAQFNLAGIYQEEKQDIEQAEHHYLQVKRQDNADAYAKAQFNLAGIYQFKKQNIEQAERHYLRVKRQDNAEAYARAQWNLALINQFKKQDIEKAERHYLRVKKQDNADVYVWAQWNLGLIYQTEKQLYNKASQCFLQCYKSSDLKISNMANIYLGDNIYFNQTKGSLKKAEEYYLNVSYSNDLFMLYTIAQIMLSVIDNNNEASTLFADANKREQSVTHYICDIRTLAENIQKQLLVTFKLNKKLKSQNKQYERQVAHYTRPGVLFSLLKNETSDFRLNVVDFMNDPTENQVLTSWLNIKTDRDSEIKSFLASFSFNHNSLNQFRLYGNENNIVGSSVSVVFNQNFFGDDVEHSINPDGINHLNKFTSVKIPKQDFIDNKTDANEKNEPLTQSFFHDLPLFRCLYFDPNNEYISLAKRNKFSFYLEHRESSAAEIEEKWNDYLTQLDEEHKIKTIRKILNQIKQKIKKLKANEKIKNLSILDQLITLAVMPISCLIKHAAFEDEDECRMIYITNIADEKIQAPTDYVQASSLFINYKTVEDYIEKIYLGPQCEAHHKLWITNHFRISSKPRSKLVKVIQSEMPLR
ncbi:sel1 repeat family protein [Gilliamella sp. B2776]|uniref:tetratricopeptide repeat protein n=3 Tax=Gilliamella TaxID=1193503 RepID=UPI00226A619B|nr:MULTISPECIES: hypothetical protein [unclassified Gilliamella]MCX8649446.1 sel1 repeat family protein [Gilliamella sp. B2779]MCX8691059.1 sel1 repeat family protein [Gilliamella sp. B2776]MCX8702416.1 sel1 repeat family protein [Gilliamella sp. B2781]WDM19062.1 sel1 repeat family protein [Gilliamella sp. B3022]